MKAVRIHSFGGPEVLKIEEVPRPTPRAGEVLVRVCAAGLNPIDWKFRSGTAKLILSPFPVIVGWDISGVVEESGREVFGMIGFPRIGSAYAEYVAAPAAHLAAKPKTIDHARAAAVPLAALTAWQALFDVARLEAGQRVLIHAAAGGVGHFAVQLAKWRGAHVIGTASARNAAFLQDLGADEVIDYTKTPFEEAVGEVDVVLDSIADDVRRRSWRVLKKGGILVSLLGAPSDEDARTHGVRGAHVFVKPDAAQLEEIAALIDAGFLRVEVSEIHPLAEAARAHAALEKGHVRGKIVLRVAP